MKKLLGILVLGYRIMWPNGCHFVGWERSTGKLSIYTYYIGPNDPKKTYVYFP